MNEGITTLIFIHIPKTGGRTIETIIDRQYPPTAIYNIYGYGNTIPERVEKLKKMSNKDKHTIRIIKGHWQFGLHKFIPQKCLYFTFLRDPIERIISHYYYVLRDNKHHLYAKVVSDRLSLKEYVARGISVELNNGQTRMISGRGRDFKFGECPNELLEIAKQNIKNYFSIVGILEQFDESLILMASKFNWRRPLYVKRNVYRQKPSKQEIGTDTLKIIERYNKLDIELYEYAKKNLSKLINESQPWFRIKMLGFKLQNFIWELSRS